MTDLEDEDDLDDEQFGALESMIQGHANAHYNAALSHEAGVKGYFQMLINDVTADYKNPDFMRTHVYNFAIERWRHWARHAEMPNDVAVREAYIDTFHYLTRLKNDFPRINHPRYVDDPFHE